MQRGGSTGYYCNRKARVVFKIFNDSYVTFGAIKKWYFDLMITESQQTLKDAWNSLGFIDTIKVFNRKEKEFFIDHEKHGERNFS